MNTTLPEVRDQKSEVSTSGPSAPAKQIITDLAELRAAIRKAHQIYVYVHDEEGHWMCMVRLTKAEATLRAIEQDKFDSYAAEFSCSDLFLNAERRPEILAQRLPARLAARHAKALAYKASYERNNMPVPDHVLKEIAGTYPITPVAACASSEAAA